MEPEFIVQYVDALTTENESWFDGEGFYFCWEAGQECFGPYGSHEAAAEAAEETMYE